MGDDPLVLDPSSADPIRMRACDAWLEVQHAFAYAPERAAEILSEVSDPVELLARAGLLRTCSAARLEADRRALARVGARLVAWPSRHYPELLRPLVDPPPVLAVRGSVETLSAPSVAIVGARAATHDGRDTARALAFSLAQLGIVVVSGLARGIDAAAHRGALEAGGRTVAVQARGLDGVYPAEHVRLAEAIAEQGAVVAELPVGAEPRPAHFPLRNRLISGLSLATVVVEARLRSGSLVTAHHALAQGREVLAVPGALRAPTSAGPNGLLRDGARALVDTEDVLRALPAHVLSVLEARATAGPADAHDASDPSTAAGAPRDERSAGGGSSAVCAPLDAPGRALLERLDRGPLDRDGLARALEWSPAETAARLLMLELDGRVREDRDGRWRRLHPASFSAGGERGRARRG